MTIIDGKKEAAQITDNLAVKVSELAARNIFPKLAIILASNNPASEIYIAAKIAKAKEIGIKTELIKFPENVSEEELLSEIERLNNNKDITAIIVQLPLPKAIDQSKIQAKIVPHKDVDAFNPYNVGMLYSGFKPYYFPPTPSGIVHLIKTCSPKIEGKDIVLVGKSNIVGKPLASLLMKEHATVTICHSLTKNLEEMTKRADIVILATGAAEFFTAKFFSPGQIVIDVGITKKANGELAGDVDFNQVSKIVDYITPVPGGVGPMTIAYLMVNCVESVKYLSK